MAARSWVPFTAILMVTIALAGCTKGNDGADDTTPPPSNGGNTPPPTQNAPPTDFAFEDQGEITGPFEKTWPITVANVGFREAHLTFTMAGLEAGAPPTARVHLTLLDPNGVPVQTGTAGLGADSNTIDWAFTPGQLAMAGEYTLAASAFEEAPLPSVGFASWSLEAHVTY